MTDWTSGVVEHNLCKVSWQVPVMYMHPLSDQSALEPAVRPRQEQVNLPMLSSALTSLLLQASAPSSPTSAGFPSTTSHSPAGLLTFILHSLLRIPKPGTNNRTQPPEGPAREQAQHQELPLPLPSPTALAESLSVTPDPSLILQPTPSWLSCKSCWVPSTSTSTSSSSYSLSNNPSGPPNWTLPRDMTGSSQNKAPRGPCRQPPADPQPSNPSPHQPASCLTLGSASATGWVAGSHSAPARLPHHCPVHLLGFIFLVNYHLYITCSFLFFLPLLLCKALEKLPGFCMCLFP